MPIVFDMKKGTAAGADKGKRMFHCCVNTYGKPSKNCSYCPPCGALTKRGTRCKKRACLDSRYCWVHLKSNDKVVIGKSRVPHGGLGLFCWTSQNIGPIERRDKNDPVFKKGDKITEYGGNVLSKRVLDEWYDYKTPEGKTIETTAPYGLEVEADGKQFYDAACMRKAGAYVNATKGTGKIRNAKLDKGALYALRNIYKGDEILTSYGRHYWRGSSPQYSTSTNRRVRPDRSVDLSGSRGKKYRK